MTTFVPNTWTDGPLARLARASFPDLEEVRHHRPVLVLGATTVLVDDDVDEQARPAGLPISAPEAA